MDQPIEQRIQHILENLRPTTALDGSFGAPQTLSDRLAYYHTPGVSIAVINNYEVEWARGFGLCDARFKKNVTPETLFQAGSISKPVFALGVMRLVQDGLLNLDEDIHHYLRSWQLPMHADWQPKITLRQLLSHTAGLTVHGFPGYQSSECLPTIPQILNGEAPSNTPAVEVNILPGLQFRYSGGGTTVGQQIVVDLLKKPFPQIMQELILTPYGLTNSTYQQPLPPRWARMAATAHPWKGLPLKGRFHTYPEMAAAGLWTTAADLAKIGVALLQTLHGKKESAPLTSATIESMLLPQLSEHKADESEYVGLGVFNAGKGDGFYFGHGGWDEGFIAQMRFYKNIGKGAVVMLNSNEGYPMIDELLQAIAVEYNWPDALPKEKEIINLEQLQSYAGLYLSKSGTQFQITTSGAHLLLQYASQPPLPIFPTSEMEFFSKALNTTIRFEKNDQDHINTLTINQAGNQIKADKQ